jgi:hypothetical protein
VDQVPSHDPCHSPTGVHGGCVEEEDGDSIAGQESHERVEDYIRRGEAGPDGKGFGGGALDEEEGVGVVVTEAAKFVGEEEVTLLGEEVAVEFGEMGLALDAAPVGVLGEDVVAGDEAAGQGVELDDATGGGPGYGAAGDDEIGREEEGGLLPIVDEDEMGPLQKTTAGLEPTTSRALRAGALPI